MSIHEWRVGDVGITGGDPGLDGPVRFVVAAEPTGVRFFYTDGDSTAHPPRSDARPLVVIDPHDRATMERLLDCWNKSTPHPEFSEDLCGSGSCWIGHMQSALIALNLTEKPDEPLGLGAVVTDIDGKRWVRGDESSKPWYGGATEANWFRNWSDLAAVAVLSEGVSDV